MCRLQRETGQVSDRIFELFYMIDTLHSNILAEKDKESRKMGRKVKGTLGFL